MNNNKNFEDYEHYIHQSRYARWNEKEGRRETWDETVTRYCTFFLKRYPDSFPYTDIYNAIFNLEVMPSMRCLMVAGEALDKDEIASYNCSYIAMDHPRAFDEILYILCCGTGVGFSVEREYVTKLPSVEDEIRETDTTIVVPDSRIGWAVSYRELVQLLYNGRVPKWDLSKIRSKGARLKTFGGRASGPEPLAELFAFTVRTFRAAHGRKLNSLEVHDLVCKIADVVVVGGVRRSALISLSNLTDDRLRNAKGHGWYYLAADGSFSSDTPHRALANNSVAYTEKPDVGTFLKEWTSLYESKSGERGIFNRKAANAQAAKSGRRENYAGFGVNPCAEIILRSAGLCNLSEVVLRPGDEYEEIKRKVELATIIGTFQSTLTNFRYIRPVWKRNAEEERLLGVSLTGIEDHPVLSGKIEAYDYGDVHDDVYLHDWLKDLKEHAIKTNATWADTIGINPSVAITCVKPSGTVSQLVDSSSGIHPRFSSYYVRSVRADKKDPIGQFLKDQGIPCEDDVTKPNDMWVFSFPKKSPEESVTRDDIGAIEQLELYKLYQEHWCEHNPSITVYVREDEWLSVGAWVYNNFDNICGVAFLPFDNGLYKQAPYQEITMEEYNEKMKDFPKVNWDKLKEYENDDNVQIVSELACSAGICEI